MVGDNYPTKHLKNWQVKEIEAGISRVNIYIYLVGVFLMLSVILLICSCNKAQAQDIPCPAKIADAIYWAEGGAKTKHPYGILVKYRHTTPRQACLNTIYHALRDWDGKGDFIAFLGARYCPVGAKNDPTGLNKNWIKNVKYFLAKAEGKQ